MIYPPLINVLANSSHSSIDIVRIFICSMSNVGMCCAEGLPDTTGEGLDGTFMQSLFDRAARDEDLINIRQWVFMPNTASPDTHPM